MNMKKILYTISISVFVVCTLSAQKIKPVQVQTIDTTVYVVEYIPIGIAQANVDRQLVQVNKQIEQVEKQLAEQVKKRDELMKQKAALEMIASQLDQAATTPPPPAATESKTTAPATSTKKAKKAKKAKN